MSSTEHQDLIKGRYIQIDDTEWKAFPEALSEGGISWKALKQLGKPRNLINFN